MPHFPSAPFRPLAVLTILVGLAAVLPAQAAAPASFIILDYHSFIGNPDSKIDFTETAFASHLDRMQAMGYRFVKLDDALAGRISGNGNIVITIDDGNHSVYPMIKHVLAPRGIPAFLFLYPGIIGERKFAMTVDQVRELAGLGYGIGAHGWFHEYMTPKAWKKNQAKVMLEVTRSGPGLRKITGAAPELFAYPFGVGAPETAAELRRAGYKWLFTADTKVVPLTAGDPALATGDIPRTLVFSWYLPTMWKELEKHLKTGG
jgi:peptidoglycan/xylan/chitin deacetylase (PgdA/CDA1 family)